jgi:hypothetical protein
MSSKNDFIIIGFKLEIVMFKVGTVLYKESLEGFFIFLVGARLIYLESPSLLEYIEIYDFLLELANLFTHFLNRVSLSLGNLRGSRSLRHYYIFILYSQ